MQAWRRRHPIPLLLSSTRQHPLSHVPLRTSAEIGLEEASVSGWVMTKESLSQLLSLGIMGGPLKPPGRSAVCLLLGIHAVDSSLSGFMLQQNTTLANFAAREKNGWEYEVNFLILKSLFSYNRWLGNSPPPTCHLLKVCSQLQLREGSSNSTS